MSSYSRSLLVVLLSLLGIFVLTPHLTSAIPSSHILEVEKHILQDSDVAQLPQLFFGDHQHGNSNSNTPRNTARTCKFFPGDSRWPNASAWNTLNSFVGGDLVMPDPIADVCYSGINFNAAECASITASWSDSDLHAGHPSSIMAPLRTGLTCLPTDNPTSSNCTIGGYPVYVVNAKTVRDVQAAVNFARNSNIRLIVKNTGHDFSGRSSGAGSLSIRTHGLTDITFVRNWTQNGYSGPAFRVGSGVEARDLYAAANAENLVVVGGEGVTVGWGGGYIQGGGHSPLSSIYGMAADHVLSFNVVTADGRFVTADMSQNSDLFWALRGGGGSTFGVLISISVKAFPDIPVTISTFSFLPSARDISQYPTTTANDDFWEVIRTYFEQFVSHADQGIYSYFNVLDSTDPGQQVFSMVPFFAPQKTAAQVTALLQPVLDTAKALNITLVLNTTSFPGFYTAWEAGFPKERSIIGVWNGAIGSRLFPRQNWLDQNSFNATFNAIRTQASATFLIAFNIAPTNAAGGNPINSVNPAWRNTVMHAITSVFWDINLRDLSTIRSIQKTFSDVNMKTWRDVSPGAGAYLNEADNNEPNFQQSFWGSNYARLYQIKQKVDPSGLFFAELAVGSEDWTTGVDQLGSLCPV